MIMELVQVIKSNDLLKRIVSFLIQPAYRPRPRWWIKNLVNPFFHRRSKGALVSQFTRMDVFPFNQFIMREYSTIEDYSCVNNGMGDVIIGSKTRVGLSNTIIGPVEIGDNVNMAQNIVVSGLNHGYEDITKPPREQKCSTAKIIVEDDCWIGANAVITSGVRIGKHSVVAAGSVVTKSCPPYSVVAGNPAKIIKMYDAELKCWVRQ